jgi:hypothetical protein
MMSEFITVRNVPILDEHDMKDDDGDVIMKLDESKLHMIADRNNRRVKETGDWIPIVIGHTKDETDSEEDQPEIVGFAHQFEVKPFRNTGRKCIKSTWKLMKNFREKIKKFPRRSIELWLSDWTIDPISLLGATTPERDLGLLRLAKDGRKKYKRIMASKRGLIRYSKVKPMENKEVVDAVLNALKQTAVWKWAESMMKQSEEEEPMPGEGEPMPMGEGEPPEESAENEVSGMGGGQPEDYDMDEDEAEQGLKEGEGEEPVRYNASCSVPSATNVSPHTTKGLRKQMARDQDRIRLARYAQRQGELEGQVQELLRRYQRSEREKDLIQLEAEGFDLDRIEELDEVEGMPETNYRKYLSRLRKRYKKPFSHESRVVVDYGRSGLSHERSREEMQHVAEEATKRGISYEEALQSFEGGLN